MTAKEFLRRARSVDRRVDEAQERVERPQRVLLEIRQKYSPTAPRAIMKGQNILMDDRIELPSSHFGIVPSLKHCI